MRCLHPHCPTAPQPLTWDDVVDSPQLRVQAAHKPTLRAWLNQHFAMGPAHPPMAIATPPAGIPSAVMKRLLDLCPCLFNQIDKPATAEATVHFCELTLGQPITSANVHAAFLVQHPGAPGFNPGPITPCSSGGDVMEMLCSEVLTTAGIPPMVPAADGWPVWTMPGHILMNRGAMSRLKALGDILVPCAPTNLVISVKSEAARERLLYSANSIEGIGFGFFKHANEFWTTRRMSLFKRMGFTAIYMPDGTHALVEQHIQQNGHASHAVNINGTALYRPLSIFGDDMRRIVGRSSDGL